MFSFGLAGGLCVTKCIIQSFLAKTAHFFPQDIMRITEPTGSLNQFEWEFLFFTFVPGA